VGDPLQLPATVLSPAAAKAGLGVSLFERLAGAGVAPLLLRHQYRMPSVISAFASRVFYRGLVRDASGGGGGGGGGAGGPLFEAGGDPCAGKGIALFDVPWGAEHGGRAGLGGGGEAAAGPSYSNAAEAEVVVAVAAHLLSVLGERGGGGGRAGATTAAASSSSRKGVLVGVISPYREQVKRVRELARAFLGAEVAAAAVSVSTVDGFQGQEVDHVILCCVRSRGEGGGGGGGGIGFLADARRLNVAVTRARVSLSIVCNAAHLARADKHWKEFLRHVAEVGRVAVVADPRLPPAPGGAGGGSVHALCPALAGTLAQVQRGGGMAQAGGRR
jgi:senataxin